MAFFDVFNEPEARLAAVTRQAVSAPTGGGC
jgi:hypothetical protein